MQVKRSVATYGTTYTLNGTALGLAAAKQYRLELIVFIGTSDYDHDNWAMKVTQQVRGCAGVAQAFPGPREHVRGCKMRHETTINMHAIASWEAGGAAAWCVPTRELDCFALPWAACVPIHYDSLIIIMAANQPTDQ